MTFSCAETRARWEGYSAEALAAEERRAVREHLAECGSCREEAASADPSLLFSQTASARVADEDIAQVLAGVRAGIAFKRTERRFAKFTQRPARGWASVAAIAAVLLLMSGQRTSHAPMNPRASSENASSTAIEVPAATAASPLPEAAPKTSSSGNATIYDWSSDRSQPRVVWIVDRSLDI